jgi:hypothetical protein
MLEFYRELTGPNGPVFLKMNHLAPETVSEIENILHTTERPSRAISYWPWHKLPGNAGRDGDVGNRSLQRP